MRRLTFLMTTVLLLSLALYGCGGGGGGSSTTSGGSKGNSPTVTAFTMPATTSALSVPVTAFTATDSAGVTGYLITESSSTPSASAAGWSTGAPATYTFTSAGTHTVYAWAKNGAGQVSAGVPVTVTVTIAGPLARAVTGSVKDPVNGNAPAAGAQVSAYLDGAGSPTATAAVGSDGRFSLTGLTDGSSYRLVFSRTGYGAVSYYGISPSQGAETELQPVLLLPNATLSQMTSINGYIRNAADNKAVPYATLVFRAGIGATTGDAIPYSKTTDETGYYSRSTFPAGSYTAQVLGTDGSTLGYFTVNAVPGVPVYNNSQNCTVSTGSGSDSYRAVLSWGSTPQDLDFHLTGPLTPGDTTTTIGNDDTPRFHIDSTQTTYPYDSGVPYSSPTITGSSTESYLDIDQANHGVDNGSETLTILTQRSGAYRFYVYNNSSSGTLASSGAVVRLYKGATLMRSFSVPAQSGNTWHVFDLDGSTISTVNTVSTVSADQTYTLARRIPGFPLQEELLFKRVLKRVRPR